MMNAQNLYKQFLSRASRFCNDEKLAKQVFNDLLLRYSEPNRHYHSLSHINTLLTDADEFFDSNIPDEVFFAIWFHDAIYDTSSGKNELHSAELAEKVLTKMNCPKAVVSGCVSLICKTADHFNAEAEDEITRFFLDADLKILGSDEKIYTEYLQAIRKEYSSLPSLLFSMGRRKFLRKALKSERIFRTPAYFEKYEQTARKNLLNELKQLS